jgi:hypothetical protein
MTFEVMANMLEDKDLFNYRKECLFQALQRNLEWAKWANEIAMEAKKWCIAYWLIYVGFFVRDATVNVTWLQIIIGLVGIFFFLTWEMISHYYSELINRHRVKLNQALAELPRKTRDELLDFDPVPINTQYTRTRTKKIFVILSMVGHETLLYFYFGLALFMLIVFIVIKYHR